MVAQWSRDFVCPPGQPRPGYFPSKPAFCTPSAAWALSLLDEGRHRRRVCAHALTDPQDLVLHDGVDTRLRPDDRVHPDVIGLGGWRPVHAPIAQERRREIRDVLGARDHPQGDGGADYTEAFQQSAVLVDKLLKGAKPAELPVEHPWRYSLAINLKTAKAIGLTSRRPCWRGPIR